MIANPELERNSEAVARIAGRLECYVWQSQARSVGSHHFTLQIVNVSDADAEASRYEIPEKTSSASSRILASQWISNCTQNHKKCRIDKISWLPTRLVNVGLDGGATRLIETKELSKDQHAPYFALSHRWAATPDHSNRLLSINQRAWMKTIPTNKMPATSQDAIQYTKSMNILYIWIDSLCIMQDSPEDWNTEAALMDKVYSQCFCNIAAFYASNENSLNTELFYTRTPDDIVTLEKRASESSPMGLSLISYSNRDRNFSKDWRSSLQVRGYEFWGETMSRYVKSSLTYSSDRLVATGAIAREYGIELDDVYLAGQWNELPLNLLWKLNGSSSFSSRPNTYRCPTWSWASLDIRYPARFQTSTPDGKALVEVLEAKVFSPPGRAHSEYLAAHIG
ncbi:hypothetical protein BTUL_0002g00880 [Botrytis tulipae]|uniref:Heterokaryon incompatibility domain-containing protein n=1 Tax=Botrytis tulipae TaxID=87230 RepID=A0A4Z1FAE5_9HELO|nr:hypothetical protein BTUL_0002g00880 [Botrytis tulipae]